MARLMRSFDWSQTALGPVGQWPESLRTTVGICLASRFPIVLYWGREYTVLYNDAYSQILGTKHPQALGQPCSVCWAEIWDTIAPMLDGVIRTGEATWSDDLLLVLHRYGFPEECYFSFSFSPVHMGAQVRGVFTAVVETTRRVLGERRLDTLRRLAERTAAARSVDEACARAADVLDHNPADLPFSMVYLVDDDRSGASLVASTGIKLATPASPGIVRLDDVAAPWPIRAAVDGGRPIVVPHLTPDVQSMMRADRPPPDTALVLPLAHPGMERPAGVFVAGASPRQVLGDEYRSFFDLVASHVAAAIAEARAYSMERQRAEALAELDRAKTSFFSSVSHEFRTPLTLMLGPLEEALGPAGGTLPDTQRWLVEAAHRNGLRLLRLVNTLLDFARVEAGRLEAAREPVDLGPFTADLASTFRSTVETAGLRLRVDCPSLDEPTMVDPDMWEKIVLNLLSNAFKFTFAGEIDVRLTRVGDEVVLTVSDTGVGIPESELARIFERFHRVRAVRARTHEGSGIGLALVRDLVALHGGQTEVESQVGQGTRFTIRLPVGSDVETARVPSPRSPAASAISAAPFVEEALRWLPSQVSQPAAGEPPVLATLTESAGGVEPGPTHGARVLVADDNADMRAYLSHLLSHSWTVEVVNDGLAALASATASPPDLILTDVMMPGLDGLELIRALRDDPRTAAVPVIVLSARAGVEAMVGGLESGADDYLAKPFAAAELLARVRANLELARSRREAQSSSARLEAALRSQGHALEVLRAVSQLTDRSPSVTEFFHDLTETVARLVSAGGVLFLTLDEGTSLTAQAGAYGFSSEVVARLRGIPCRADGEGIVDRVVHGGAVYRSRIDLDDPEIQRYRQWLSLTRTGDVLAIAWRAGDRPIGMVAAFDSTRPGGFTDEDVWVLRVAGKAAGVVWLHRLAETALGEMRDAEADRLRGLARRAAELEEIKSEFLRLASHELRGPVAVLRGYLAMMQSGDLSHEDMTPIYQILLSKVDEINLLVEQMLETARLEDGQLTLEVEPHDLREVARTAAAGVSMRLTARHRLELDLPDEPIVVTCDRTRLLTILSNLLDNAVKYSPQGGTVRLSSRVDATGSSAEISVSDQGIGIDPQEMRTIFTRFGRVVNADNSHIAGTGLGLYVARQLARMHGGDIEITSRRRVGTTVVVTLPMAVDSSI